MDPLLALFPLAIHSLENPAISGAMKEIFVFIVAWFIVRKEMRTQFDKMAKSLHEMSETVKGLSETMVKVEARHNGRLNNLERDVYHIKQKLTINSTTEGE